MRSYFTAIAFLLIPLFCQAQYIWHELPNAPHSHRHDDMFFLNPQKGWVTNPYYNYQNPNQFGQVWTTNDGGTTWTKIFDSSTTFIRCVGFTDTQHGWFGNLEGLPYTPDTNFLYETADGGHTWSPVTHYTGFKPSGICGISVVTDSVVYAYGRYDGPACFMKTTDQGNSWVSTDMNSYAHGLVDGWFFSKDTGIVVGNVGSPSKTLILSTYDGGDSWQVRHTGNVNYEGAGRSLSLPEM
ncbi:MAG: hypothetical protein BGO69_12930 [Bacteroidetes bacterium 46-16]|nr:MAG: hypothetical protein BGO69_12930 [Bacteroidetes bacterium 46-16]